MKDINKFFKSPFSAATHEKLEKKILNFLRKDISPNQIFEKIKNSSDFEQVSRFLYNSGLDKTLLDFSVQRLKKQKPIAWPYILKLFIKYKIKPDEKMEKILFHHWLKNKENHSVALFSCEDWGDISPEFQQLRAVYIQEMEEKNLSEERDLLEQLEFVQAQQLIKEEEEIIIKLLLIDSENSKYKQLKSELEEKKAILTIEDQKRTADKTDRLENYISPSFLFEKHPLKDKWFKIISLAAKKNSKHTKNMALFLYFCHWPDKALNVLETHISRISDYWFYLDWVIETKQYTKGLELINHLFLEMGEEDAASFLPLIYIKSQMLYALGRKSEAIEYLTTISQVKPDYKSTQYLLDKWLKKI